ncbi:MAG: 4Fe-4S dicluster domain-containing protein [Bryobacterales bacterium]|nr:4Fe-4S dicluster domain-containing protein [Bryobacterales bacterium]
MAFAILFDSTKCVGCRQCEGACAEKWKNPYNDQIAAEEKISSHKLTAVVTKGEKYVRRLCMHCIEPACVSACPVGALQKTPQGPVVYDADKCMGCRYCMTACAFGAPAYEWNARLPKLAKCNMCLERQVQGKPTACTEACPAEATVSGDRDAMIALARKRMAESPGTYQPHIYGTEEVGGTSVLMISDVPFSQLGLPTNLPKENLPGLTWRALETIPSVVTVGSVLLSGIYWITHRRMEVAKAEGRKA